MPNIKFTTERNAVWKDEICFAQSNSATLSQQLRCLEGYEAIDVCFKDILISGLR